MNPLSALRLGRVEYEDGLKLQEAFCSARRAGAVADTLLLLEHPAVITLGRGATRANILASEEVLQRQGVEVFETSRGGDVTYHGPGQIVGYPIFHLPPGRQDVRRYVRDVEESMIRALARFGLSAARISKWPGVWLGAPAIHPERAPPIHPERSEAKSRDASTELLPGPSTLALRADARDEVAHAPRKIGAIGVHLSRWVTSHGFALNVRTDLSHFQLIVPCGIQQAGVTSMELELGDQAPSLHDVERALAQSFAEVFDLELQWAAPPRRTVNAAVLSPDRSQVLLLKRPEDRGGFWQIVTGHLEPGETPEQGASREVLEETGAALSVRSLGYEHAFALGDGQPPNVAQETAFMATWRGGAPRLSEHASFRWASRDEAIAALPFKGLKETVRRAFAAR